MDREALGYSLWGHKEPDTTEHAHTWIALALDTFCAAEMARV